MASVFPQGFGASSAVSDSIREEMLSEAFNTQGRVAGNKAQDADEVTKSYDRYDTSYNDHDQTAGGKDHDFSRSDLDASISPMPLKVNP